MDSTNEPTAAPSALRCSTLPTGEHQNRFRLAVVMPNGYGMDVSWEDRASLEHVLRLLVDTMDDEGGIDNAIKTVVDVLASKLNA